MTAKPTAKRRGRDVRIQALVNEAELAEIDEQASIEFRSRSEYLRIAALERARAARKGRP